jgi:tetratricopeptide (TPR) repeat protein
MSDSDTVKSLIKEAEIYRKQGLLKQAASKYRELQEFARKNQRLSQDPKFVAALEEKIRKVEGELREVEAAPDRPELSGKMQDLIARLFAFSGSKDMAAVEAAVALAKFGQYERAVAEFQRLIREGVLPRVAATNLLSCHLTLGSPEAGIAQFAQWVSGKELPSADLEYLRGYLKSALDRKGIQTDLPRLEEAPAAEGPEEEKEDEGIAISSVRLTLPAGPRKGEVVEYDVTFQSGNSVSILIPSAQREVADAFKAGSRVEDVQCYSAMGVFNGRGTVTAKSTISSGPKRGDFTLDLTIDSG